MAKKATAEKTAPKSKKNTKATTQETAPARRGKAPEKREACIAFMRKRKTGVTLQEIADEVGCSLQYVRVLVKELRDANEHCVMVGEVRSESGKGRPAYKYSMHQDAGEMVRETEEA